MCIRDSHPEDAKCMESLNAYERYVYRELYDENTGVVYNDINRNNDWHRLYNYPWVANFQIALYRLKKDVRYLLKMCIRDRIKIEHVVAKADNNCGDERIGAYDDAHFLP